MEKIVDEILIETPRQHAAPSRSPRIRVPNYVLIPCEDSVFWLVFSVRRPIQRSDNGQGCSFGRAPGTSFLRPLSLRSIDSDGRHRRAHCPPAARFDRPNEESRMHARFRFGDVSKSSSSVRLECIEPVDAVVRADSVKSRQSGRVSCRVRLQRCLDAERVCEYSPDCDCYLYLARAIDKTSKEWPTCLPPTEVDRGTVWRLQTTSKPAHNQYLATDWKNCGQKRFDTQMPTCETDTTLRTLHRSRSTICLPSWIRSTTWRSSFEPLFGEESSMKSDDAVIHADQNPVDPPLRRFRRSRLSIRTGKRMMTKCENSCGKPLTACRQYRRPSCACDIICSTRIKKSPRSSGFPTRIPACCTIGRSRNSGPFSSRSGSAEPTLTRTRVRRIRAEGARLTFRTRGLSCPSSTVHSTGEFHPIHPHHM